MAPNQDDELRDDPMTPDGPVPDEPIASDEPGGADPLMGDPGTAEAAEDATGTDAPGTGAPDLAGDDAGEGDTPVAASADEGDAPITDAGEGVPEGEALLVDGSSDDPDAPDVHPGAADPAAADSPAGRRDLLVVGGIVLLVLAAVAAFVLLRGAGDPAYTVYGDDVSVEELQAQLDGLVDPELVTAAGEIDDATPEQRGVLAQAISSVITQEVMSRAAEERDITVTEEDVDAQLDEVIEAGFGGDREAFEAQIESAGLTEDVVRAQFRTALLAEQLAGDSVTDVADEDVQAAYDEQFTEPIVSHILTETREEAEAARERVEGGEEFGAVAAEVSIDPGSGAQGGQLGPLREGQFVPEFEEAATALEPGEISEVVESEFGFHVITVEAPPTFDEVSDLIRDALEDQSMNDGLAELAAQLDDEAQVTVNPAYGTWGGLAQGLIAPQADLPLDGEGALPEGGTAPQGEAVPAPDDAAQPGDAGATEGG